MNYSATDLRNIAQMVDSLREIYEPESDFNISEVIVTFKESREPLGKISDVEDGDYQFESFVPSLPKGESWEPKS